MQMHHPSFFYIIYEADWGKKRKWDFASGRSGRFFHLSMILDEKKNEQTSDVSEKASKCFKALKRMADGLVYQ